MATYYSSTQRDAGTMIYLKKNYPGSYQEVQGNMMTMNYPLAGSNAQGQQGSEIPSLGGLDSSQNPQHEVLSSVGEWTDERNEIMFMHPGGSSLYGQGLSLSIGTQIPLGIQVPPIHFRGPNPGFNSFFGANGLGENGGSVQDDENLQDKVDNNQTAFGISSIYRPILNSKYLKVAQELLEEVVSVKKALNLPEFEKSQDQNVQKSNSRDLDGGSNDHSSGEPSDAKGSADKNVSELSPTERINFENKLTKLLSMLDEIDRRYKKYYHQMQIVVSSFDTVAGNGTSEAYTDLALQTISRHFRCLCDAIISQIQATRKSLGDQDVVGNGKVLEISRLKFVDQQLRQQRALQQLGMMQHHTWRPQRGLPESSVSVLRAWLFEHFLHPYPKDSDKIMLARQTGLTRSQVSNWFINARVRIWKPMVEEMYKEETKKAEIDTNSSSNQAQRETNKHDSRNSDDPPQQSAKTNIQLPTADMAGSSQVEGVVFQDRPQAETLNTFRLIQAGNRFIDRPAAGAFHMSELGSFPNSTVSLTLGLHNYEGEVLPLSNESRRNFTEMASSGMYNPNSTSNATQPELASHLLHDFVA